MSRHGVLQILSRPRWLWLAIFGYTILTGLLVQLVLLPHVFPEWQKGSGLLRGVDAPVFHETALQVWQDIKVRGWSAWRPWPGGQFVSGVAAAVYTLVYPAPWALLPLNGVLNAFAGVGVFLILARLWLRGPPTLLAALPFILMPSSLLWTSQLHNENYAIPGVVGILYGWILFATVHAEERRARRTQALRAIVAILIGSLLLGAVRDYILTAMAYLCAITAVGIFAHWMIGRSGVRAGVLLLVLMLAACLAMAMVAKAIGSRGKFFANLLPVPGSQASTLSPPLTAPTPPKGWQRVSWLPAVIDRSLSRLALIRRSYIRRSEPGGSGIDLDVEFQDAGELLGYVPRALQIAFLAPFPNLWFTESQREGGSAMRAASGIEMIFVYGALLGLPVFVWRSRLRPATWVTLFICTGMLVAYAICITNLGSLYRFRYPYLMPLVCMGVAGWLSLRSGAAEQAQVGTRQ